MTRTENYDGKALIVSAPGKVILFGEHAVVYGKSAVAASLGLRTYAWLRPGTAGAVTLHLPDICPHALVLDIDELQRLGKVYAVHNANAEPFPLTDATKSLLIQLLTKIPIPAAQQAALSFLHLYFAICKSLMPLEVCVRSALPVGAGLGSSASFSVSVAAGLLTLSGAVRMPSPEGSFSPSELEVINQWAFMSEKVIHGNPSGIDNSVSTFGGAKLYSKGKLEFLHGFTAIKFLLTDTRVPKDTKLQVENVRQRKGRFPSVLDPLIESVQGISNECRALFDALEQSKITQSEAYRALETLIDMNHCIMAACGVSHPCLEKVRQVTSAHGLRSKLTGAGGGGCALTLVRDDTSLDIVNQVKSQLEAEGFHCFETSVGCPGVGARWLPSPESEIFTSSWDEFVGAGRFDWNQIENL